MTPNDYGKEMASPQSSSGEREVIVSMMHSIQSAGMILVGGLRSTHHPHEPTWPSTNRTPPVSITISETSLSLFRPPSLLMERILPLNGSLGECVLSGSLPPSKSEGSTRTPTVTPLWGAFVALARILLDDIPNLECEDRRVVGIRCSILFPRCMTPVSEHGRYNHTTAVSGHSLGYRSGLSGTTKTPL